ncbi:unnamed protein product [Pylaiella littoralis]
MKKRPRAEEGATTPSEEQEEEEEEEEDHTMNDSPTSNDTSDDGREEMIGGVEDGEPPRTCVSCRKSKVKCSKVKCSKGLPCNRCRRLKLTCVAQVRGRGRPVASTTAAKKSPKSKHLRPEVQSSENGVGAGRVGGRRGGRAGTTKGGEAKSSFPGSGSGSSSSSSSFPVRGGAAGAPGASGVGIMSSARLPSRAREGPAVNTAVKLTSTLPAAAAAIVAADRDSSSDVITACRTEGGGVGSSFGSRLPLGLSLSSSDEVPPPLAAVALQTAMSCPVPFGYNGPVPGGPGLGNVDAAYAQQHLDASSHSCPPHLMSAGHQVSSAAAEQQPQQQQEQQNMYASLRGSDYGGARHNNPARGGSISGSGSSSWRAVYDNGVCSAGGASVPNGTWLSGMEDDIKNDTNTHINAVNGQQQWEAISAPLATSAAMVNGISNVDTGGLLSPPTRHHRANDGRDGGFKSFNGRSFSWAETMGDSKDGAAAADADAEDFLSSKSPDTQAPWLMGLPRDAGDGSDAGEVLPQVNEGGVEPTDVITKVFWKLFDNKEVNRPKAIIVIRHWALLARERRSTQLMHKTVNMARALRINVAEILNDYGIYAMFHELLREAEAGNTVEPARSVNPRRVEASPYIQELLSPFAAVSMRVVLRGQSCFYHNDVCARLFLSTEEANELYATKNKDVWASFIHPDDHQAFFDCISMQLFFSPGHQSEFKEILKCRYKTGVVSLALVHFRCEFLDEGNYAAFGLSVLPLPKSDYMRNVELEPAAANAHAGAGAGAGSSDGGSGDGAAASAAAGDSDSPLASLPSRLSSGQQGTADGLSRGGGGSGGVPSAAATTTTLCDVSLPVEGSISGGSNSSSSASSSPATGAATVAAARAPAVARAASAAGTGGGGGREGAGGGPVLLLQPPPPFDVEPMLQQREVGSWPPRAGGAWGGGTARSAAWAAVEMGGGRSIGLRDDNGLNPWRESVSGPAFHSQGGGAGTSGGGSGGGSAFQEEAGWGSGRESGSGRRGHPAVGLGPPVAGR